MGLLENFIKAGRTLFAEPTIAEPKDERYQELGRSGTQSFHGVIVEDFNAEFQGQRAVAIYNKMRRTDATINASLTAMKLPILAAERTIEPADANDEKQKEIAEFVRAALFDKLEGGFEPFLREALNCLDFGFYYFEKVWEIRDGQVCLKKLAPRLPTAHYLWIMQSKPDVPGVTQMLKASDPKLNTMIPEIPMSKLVLFTNNKEGDNHEGISILRTCYKHWYYKDSLYRIDGIKHERGAGVLNIILPKGASADDKAAAEELGENFKIGEATFIVSPSPEWKMELMTAGISDQSAALMASVQHHDRMIVLNTLTQFLDLGSGNGGSFALSKDQTSFFGLSLRAIAKNLENTINEQLIKELVILNFGEQEKYPKLAFGEIGEVDYTSMSGALKTLADAGLLETRPDILSWVRKTFGLPEMTIEQIEEQQEEDKTDGPTPELTKPEEPKEEPEVPEEEDELDEEKELAERKFPRVLTFAEERVKLAELDDYFTSLEDEAFSTLKTASDEQKESLMKEIEGIIDTKDLAALAALALIAQGPLAGAIREYAKQALEKGKQTAANELGQALPTTTPFAKKVLALKADLLLQGRTAEIVESVKTKVLAILQKDIGKSQAMFEISKAYDDVANYWNGHIASQIVVDSVDTGRASVFEANKTIVYALQRSEVLDTATCPTCISLDGRIVDPMNPFSKLGQVHTNCRGIWVALLKTDTVLPAIKDIPKSLLNRFNTLDGVPETNNYVPVKKPIIGKASRAAQAIADGDLV